VRAGGFSPQHACTTLRRNRNAKFGPKI
jgi:hypothetical protein